MLWVRIFGAALFLTCGNALIICGYCIGAFIGCLLWEIMCFAMPTAFIWLALTVERWDYGQKKIANVLSTILKFIGGASRKNNDRIIRILIVNYGYRSSDTLERYISKCKKKERLHKAGYLII